MRRRKLSGRQEPEAVFGKQRTSLLQAPPGLPLTTSFQTLPLQLWPMILPTQQRCILEQEKATIIPMQFADLESGNRQTVEVLGASFHPRIFQAFIMYRKSLSIPAT